MLLPNQYGVWQIDITVDGKRVRKSTRTKDKALAQKLHALTEAEMLKGSWGLGKKASYTLEDAFSDGMATHWKTLKYSFKVDQNWTLLTEGAKPLLDKRMDVTKVTASVIMELSKALALQGNSAATINRKLAVVRKLLNLCAEWGKIPHVPRVPTLKEPPSRHRVLTAEEEVSMMRFFREKYPEQASLFEFLLSSANRISEVLAITWFDVNFKDGVVRLVDTKSGDTLHKPMTEVMRAVLEARKGLIKPFPYTLDSVESTWKYFRSFMGYQEDSTFVIHSLRHTCASRLVAQGVDLRRVQMWLGHRSYTTTLKYAQLANTHLRDVVGVLNTTKDFDRSLTYERQSDNSSEAVVPLRSL